MFEYIDTLVFVNLIFLSMVLGTRSGASLHVEGKVEYSTNPDNKVHGTNMGPTWGRRDPGGPHVGPMNLAIWEGSESIDLKWMRKPMWIWKQEWLMYTQGELKWVGIHSDVGVYVCICVFVYVKRV